MSRKWSGKVFFDRASCFCTLAHMYTDSGVCMFLGHLNGIHTAVKINEEVNLKLMEHCLDQAYSTCSSQAMY